MYTSLPRLCPSTYANRISACVTPPATKMINLCFPSVFMPCRADGALCHVGRALLSEPPPEPRDEEEGGTPPDPRRDPPPAALGDKCERVRRELVFISGGASLVNGNKVESSLLAVDS